MTNNVTITYQTLHIKKDVVLRTDSQRPTDEVHVSADVHPLYIHRPRGGREQARQDGPEPIGERRIRFDKQT